MSRMDDLHGVEGYEDCRSCGAMVLTPVAHQTGRLCLKCFDEGLGEMRFIEVMHRGARVMLPTGGRKRKRKKKNTATQRQAEHAQRSARRRLASIYPELYEMLYDEERYLRGLNPIIRRNRQDRAVVASETLDFESVYDALRSSGESDA